LSASDTYHDAVVKLANPATAGLRPTTAGVRPRFATTGFSPLSSSPLSTQGRTATIATSNRALAELASPGVAVVDGQTLRWTLRPAAHHPLLEVVDLHGAHDFRHTLLHLAGGRRHPGPGHRRADGP
jgi:hypothetical protein